MVIFSDRGMGIRHQRRYQQRRYQRCVIASLFGVITLSTPYAANGQARPLNPSSVHSQSTNPGVPSLQIAQARPVVFKPRKDAPRPKATIGGASRHSGHCPQAKVSPTTLGLQAIVPPSQTKGQMEAVLTTAAYPTLLVYLPVTTARQAEFTVMNERGKGLFQTIVDLPREVQKTPVILRLTLPNTALPATTGLQPDTIYQWVFTLMCKPGGAEPNDPFVRGMVSRIAPDAALQKKLTTAKGLDKVNLYAEAGIWQEAVTELANLRLTKPTDPDLLAAWKSLLKSANLEATSQAPIR